MTDRGKENLPVVAVAWSGLPWYAARMIRAGCEATSASVIVLGTRPEKPMSGLERILGREIMWLEKPVEYSWARLGLSIPDLFIHTGWNIPCFNSLASEVRRNHGSVVSMIDNCYKGSLRQYLGALIFRLRYRRLFDAVWVPGASGRRLMHFFGVPNTRIFEGQYGAAPDVFQLGLPLDERPKEILFVGQYILRKGITSLVEGFRRSGLAAEGWNLRLVGDGPERPATNPTESISVERFLSEAEVSMAMKRARIFVLPSREEHWGVVLAEAALSGCMLLAGREVGAAADLITPVNGALFPAGNNFALAKSLRHLAALPSAHLTLARAESRRLGERFGPRRWAEEFVSILEKSQREWPDED